MTRRGGQRVGWGQEESGLGVGVARMDRAWGWEGLGVGVGAGGEGRVGGVGGQEGLGLSLPSPPRSPLLSACLAPLKGRLLSPSWAVWGPGQRSPSQGAPQEAALGQGTSSSRSGLEHLTVDDSHRGWTPCVRARPQPLPDPAFFPFSGTLGWLIWVGRGQEAGPPLPCGGGFLLGTGWRAALPGRGRDRQTRSHGLVLAGSRRLC